MPTLRGLVHGLQGPAASLVALGRSVDRSLVVTSVRRSYGEQAKLYQRFLEGKSGGLPAARPGTSKHEFGLAFDIARPGVEPHSDALLAQLGAIWNRAGGHWSAGDPVHFEV